MVSVDPVGAERAALLDCQYPAWPGHPGERSDPQPLALAADPRYPLQIVEVDEETLTLKRDTLTTAIDREPDETPYVRFSNFFAYNDRETGHIRLVLKKAYSEHQENVLQMPEPGYRFTLEVPN